MCAVAALMMPFVCFLGNFLSDLLEPPKACQGALSQLPPFTSPQPPWFLILSADNQIDRCLTCTCSSYAQSGCFSCSPIRLFRPCYPRGRRGRFLVRDSSAFVRKRWTSVKNGGQGGGCENKEKTYKLLRISTCLIEISCPIFFKIHCFTVRCFFSQRNKMKETVFRFYLFLVVSGIFFYFYGIQFNRTHQRWFIVETVLFVLNTRKINKTDLVSQIKNENSFILHMHSLLKSLTKRSPLTVILFDSFKHPTTPSTDDGLLPKGFINNIQCLSKGVHTALALSHFITLQLLHFIRIFKGYIVF